MRLLLLLCVTMVASCGPESSPEGRVTMRIDALQKEVESLKVQNQAILDSLRSYRALLEAKP